LIASLRLWLQSQKSICNIPEFSVTRQLDDTIVVAPARTMIVQDFLTTCRNVCEKLSIPLAQSCPKIEKAFFATTHGTVLGTTFNSESMMWQLPDYKHIETFSLLRIFFTNEDCTLRFFQNLTGKLNDFHN